MLSKISIFGAGLSGLIAARMLHESQPVVYERQERVPNNHYAVLRFRSMIVGDVTNIPFKKVNVVKSIVPGYTDVQAAARYSHKVTGKLHNRSVLDLRTVERYVCPPDFIQRLASTAEIRPGTDFVEWSHNLIAKDRGLVISTIPMPIMMEIFKWKDRPQMSYAEGWNVKYKVHQELECDLNLTVYNPSPSVPWYRATLSAGEVIFEGIGTKPGIDMIDNSKDDWLDTLGLQSFMVYDRTVKESRYQKISDMSRGDRMKADEFIIWLSKQHNIYSLGRFATWRPKLLLDDVVNDVRQIMRMVDGTAAHKF